MKVAIIPARGGSKRIPNKNIKSFAGKPIIAYSIKAAIDSGCFDRIIVSTDDHEIAELAKGLGAEVPFFRPDILSNDHAQTLPVVKHAVDWLCSRGVSVNFVCCLYATAPFVDAELIRAVFKQLEVSGLDYCFTVTTFPHPIQRAIRINKEGDVEMFSVESQSIRSQDLEEAYHDAGQLYWGRAEAFKGMKPLFSRSSSPFIIPRYMVQDIDTLEDWKRAELMYQAYIQSD